MHTSKKINICDKKLQLKPAKYPTSGKENGTAVSFAAWSDNSAYGLHKLLNELILSSQIPHDILFKNNDIH